jgi:hypothetical protein
MKEHPNGYRKSQLTGVGPSRIQCMTMTVDRLLPSQEAADLIALTPRYL